MSKATLYLDDQLHRALRLKAAESARSMSELVNDALRQSLLEDADDLQVWRDRRNEPTVDFGSFVEQLKEDGVLDR